MVSVTESHYLKTYAFESSKLLLDICLPDSRILYFWYVLKSIHKFIIELHALQCLFVRESNKKQRRGRIILNFTKGETFSSLMTTNYSWEWSLNSVPLLVAPLKKALLSLSVWARGDIPGHSIKRRTYWFILKISRMFPIPLSRNRMMSTFIIVNITPSPRYNNMHFPIPKSLSFSLHLDLEQNILGQSFQRTA